MGREDAERRGLVSSLDRELWQRFLDGPEPVEDDAAYQRWLRATVRSLLGRDGASHAIASDDERQWADRAVMERVLAWAPGRYEVVLGAASAAALGRDPTPFELWLRSVHAIVAREPYAITGDQELAWARRAIDAKVLVWDIEGVTLRLPDAGGERGAPYR